MTLRIYFIILLVALTCSVSFGQDNHKKFSIGAKIGYISLMMDDFNHYIKGHFNEAGFDFKEFNQSFKTGIHSDYHLSNRIALRIGYDYYFPYHQSDDIVLYHRDAQGVTYAQSNLEVSITAKSYNLYFEPLYKFFEGKNHRFMAGAGIIYSFGKLQLTADDDFLDYHDNENWKNSGIGFLLNGDFEYHLNRYISLMAGIEIQYNIIPDLKDENGNMVQIPNEIISNETISMDYSGATLSAGLVVYPFNIKKAK